MKQFRIVNDFRALGIGEPLLHVGESLVFHVVGGDARMAWLRGNFDGEHARAEAFFVRVLRIERKPCGGFVAARDGVEKFLEVRRQLEGRVVGLLSRQIAERARAGEK